MKKLKLTSKSTKNLINLAAILVSLLIAILVSNLLIVAYYFTHESGHIAFGFFDNVIKGNTPNFKITAWQELPLIPFVKLPQQTTMSNGIKSLNFIFGGTFLVLALGFFLSFLLHKHTKKKRYWFLLLLFGYHEIMGNFLCGTDNLHGNPYALCSQFWIKDFWIYPFIIGFYALVVSLVFNRAKKFVLKITEKQNIT